MFVSFKCIGACRFMVRRHDGFRAARPDSIFWKDEQRGGHLFVFGEGQSSVQGIAGRGAAAAVAAAEQREQQPWSGIVGCFLALREPWPGVGQRSWVASTQPAYPGSNWDSTDCSATHVPYYRAPSAGGQNLTCDVTNLRTSGCCVVAVTCYTITTRSSVES